MHTTRSTRRDPMGNSLGRVPATAVAIVIGLIILGFIIYS